jgi:hypothetical protein
MDSRSPASTPNSLTLTEGIVEIVTIAALEEFPWLFEMARGDRLAISLMASQSVDVVICAEGDYDAWVEGGMATDRPVFGFLESNSANRHSLQIRSPIDGLLVVLVVNPNATEVEVAISLVEDQRSFSAPFLASQ